MNKKNVKKIVIIVLVVLIVILLVGKFIRPPSLHGAMNDASRSAFRTEFITFLNEVALQAREDFEKGEIHLENESHCYSIDDLDAYNFRDEFHGSALVEYRDHRYIVTGWLYNDDYMIHGAKDDLLTSDDVVKRGDVTHFENCGR